MSPDLVDQTLHQRINRISYKYEEGMRYMLIIMDSMNYLNMF